MFRTVGGLLGIFLVVVPLLMPGQPNLWLMLIGFFYGGIFLYFTITGKSPVFWRADNNA